MTTPLLTGWRAQGPDPAGCEGLHLEQAHHEAGEGGGAAGEGEMIMMIWRWGWWSNDDDTQDLLGIMVWYCSVQNGLKYAETWDTTGREDSMAGFVEAMDYFNNA